MIKVSFFRNCHIPFFNKKDGESVSKREAHLDLARLISYSDMATSNLDDIAKRIKIGFKINLKTDVISHIFQHVLDPSKKDDYKMLLEALGDKSSLKDLDTIIQALKKAGGDVKNINEIKSLIRPYNKWTSLGLSSDMFLNHIEEACFLLESRLIFSIVGYQNSTETGAEKHDIKDGKHTIYILKEGWRTSVSELMEEFKIDTKNHCLEKKESDGQSWYYFDEGLVPQDRFLQHHLLKKHPELIQNAELKPVLKLSTEELGQVVAQGRTFFPEGKGLDQRTCAVQFFTHPCAVDGKYNSQKPAHCGFRIINKDGFVYSTGFGVTLKEEEYRSSSRSFLATVNGQPAQLDQEEFRPHNGRVTTTIAITPDQLKDMLESLNSYRKSTVRFNIIKQNCVRLGVHIASKADVFINVNIPFRLKATRFILSSEKLSKKRDYKELVDDKLPRIVRRVVHIVLRILLFIPKMVVDFFMFILLTVLGSYRSSPNIEEDGSHFSKKDLDNMSLENIESIFKNNIKSLIKRKAFCFADSSVFINWQLQQTSTQIMPYIGKPSMSVMPLSTDRDIKSAEELKNRLKMLFRKAVPIEKVIKPFK